MVMICLQYKQKKTGKFGIVTNKMGQNKLFTPLLLLPTFLWVHHQHLS